MPARANIQYTCHSTVFEDAPEVEWVPAKFRISWCRTYIITLCRIQPLFYSDHSALIGTLVASILLSHLLCL
jgi:hypothetical protein